MALNYQSNVFPPSLDQGQYLAPGSTPSLATGQIYPLITDQTGRQLVSSQSNKNTYRAGLTNQTLYSTAACVVLEMQGSSTMTVRVKRISIYTYAVSATFNAEFTLCRATTVGGGTPNAVTPQKMDTVMGAATAVLNNYTAASTAGTGQAVISAKLMPCITGAATAAAQTVTWDFGSSEDAPLVLRGTSQWIEVFNNTTTLTGGKYGFEVIWEEDNS